MYLHTHVETYIHLYTHTQIFIYLYMLMHIYVFLYRYVHTYMHTYVHTYIHPYMRTCIHTSTHPYIHSGIARRLLYVRIRTLLTTRRTSTNFWTDILTIPATNWGAESTSGALGA